MDKLIVPCIYLKDGRAVGGFAEKAGNTGGDAVVLAKKYGSCGADGILVFDLSEGDEAHEEALGVIKRICLSAELPVTGAGHIRRMEDVKKLIYAGCQRVVLNGSRQDNLALLLEVSTKFGKEKIVSYLPEVSVYRAYAEDLEAYAGMLLCKAQIARDLQTISRLPVMLFDDEGKVPELLQAKNACGVTGQCVSLENQNLMELKISCRKQGIPVNTFESKIAWSSFKLNSDGMVPVIVQDHQTDAVLMLAYMNESAFAETLATGKMTYWSRSRDELWTKGLTSGHVQYVKSLTLDCDGDTILAKVSQTGAACHTGNRTCFFRELVKKDCDCANPLKVFQNVYDVIMDRKEHPRVGSYTNYLFDKGIDKILKKVGEECTEIVIAAKNPDKEEMKSEISDFLYHVMVLMAEKDVTWEEITRELARR